MVLSAQILGNTAMRLGMSCIYSVIPDNETGIVAQAYNPGALGG